VPVSSLGSCPPANLQPRLTPANVQPSPLRTPQGVVPGLAMALDSKLQGNTAQLSSMVAEVGGRGALWGHGQQLVDLAGLVAGVGQGGSWCTS
jgi:hypothetical protein